jgi:TonB family protein
VVGVVAVCLFTCTTFAVAALARVRPVPPEQSTKTQHEPDVRPDVLEILAPTDGVDFTAFSRRLLQVVRRSWYAKMPQDAKTGEAGRAVVQFKIRKNGTLDHTPTVEVSSGNNALDNAAVAAIRASAPFEARISNCL